MGQRPAYWMIILSLLREITFDEFPVSGGEKAEGGGGGGCPKKTARVALRNIRNNLCRFQGFLHPLTIALVRADHQPGLKLETIDILPRYCCSRTAIFSSNSFSFFP